jgi:S-adenosylmethionine:tRNA ribosyltransferase-isomerase
MELGQFSKIPSTDEPSKEIFTGVKRSELEYDLPKDRIAQRPPTRRSGSRLLHLRADGTTAHRSFPDFPSLLRPGDVLVLNDTRVLPARIHAVRATGGRVRILFLRKVGEDRAEVLLHARGRVLPGEVLGMHGGGPQLRVVRRTGDGRCELSVEGGSWDDVLRVGRPPLPPYIKRPFEKDTDLEGDRRRYQTVYARNEGSIAAPTAGLHFDEETLAAVRDRGVETVFVTLHVGPGTFRPVEAEDLGDHRLEAERYEIPASAADAVNAACREGRRVVACGTTVVRVLESTGPSGRLEPGAGETDLFVYPPFRFRVTGAMLTNFHLPGSTLLALTAAFVGTGRILAAYREARDRGYRFYSYGDATFLEKPLSP